MRFMMKVFEFIGGRLFYCPENVTLGRRVTTDIINFPLESRSIAPSATS